MNCSSEYPLKILYLYLTEGCNLLCRHCWLAPRFDPSGLEQRSLDPALARSVVEQALELGLRAVKLTGGEPFLHPRIREILQMVRDHDLHLAIETNGTRVTPEFASLAGACQRPFASVSLDGADRDSHEYVRGVEGCFEAAQEGLSLLVEAGVRTQVILTVMRHNSGQLEALVRLAESLGVDSVKFNVVQPTNRGEKMHANGQTLSVAELIELGQWVEGELARTTPLKLYFCNPVAFRSLSHMYDDDGIGCSTCGILKVMGVLPDGSYALCGVGRMVGDLVFGRAGEDDLKEVWNHPVLESLRQGLPEQLEGVCSRCLMRNQCKGACIAQNYYTSRSLWAPFWFCKVAEEAGLFPPSRQVATVAVHQ